MRKTMNKKALESLTKTAPEKIYLCVADSDVHLDDDEQFDGDEVTWAEDAPVAYSIAYIRADVAEKRIASKEGGEQSCN